jgi:dTDP-4-dehydrorhamnose reductase
MLFAVIGDKGMFGQDMCSLLKSQSEEVVGFNRSNLDLSQSAETLAQAISKADVVINAVAYTEVDEAEENQAEANLVNGEYAGKLAQVAKLLGAKLIHISTDYVFPGTSSSPIKNTNQTSPVNAYGQSKLLGESLISQSGARYQIFRTAWLFGARGNCFPRSIAKKLYAAGEVDVVDDQFGQPTWTKDLAAVIYHHSLYDNAESIVHASASGVASWFDFAKAIADSLPNPTGYKVRRISSSDLEPRAKRPGYSVLDNTDTEGPIIGNWLDRWRVAAPEILASIK